MATISTDIDVEARPRSTRLNEIFAIALVALALLLGLCLVSYNPNDPSWNAAGQVAAQNWIGTVGANVAAACFQAIGLAAYLLPVLLLMAAWRRFRSQRINAPLSQLAGLVTIVLAASGLLALANLRPFYDRSFNAGGFTGSVISRTLVAELNIIGTGILLGTIAVTGILLATNFSFTLFYDWLASALSNRFVALRSIPERIRARRQARREARQLRLEAKRLARAEGRPAEVNVVNQGPEITNAATTTSPIVEPTTEIAAAFESFKSATSGSARTMSAAAGAAAAAPSKRGLWPARGRSTETSEAARVEEMVREAAVKRKTEAPDSGTLPFDGNRRVATNKAMSDYQMPVVDFLNEPQMRREQADDELLNMATRLAEKCREFNVTGQI